VVIRLSHEANGTWNPDNVGNSPADYALWREFWRKTALAMKSVPGAHFTFDWTINAGVRPIPLSSFYPGDDVVDIAGIDAYDGNVPAGQDRWKAFYGQPDGIGDVARFAREHHKQLSIPEWGLLPPGGSGRGGGDDPAYVNGIASVVRDNDVAYQSYFFAQASRTQLDVSPRSKAAFRRAFGRAG
jgi:Glycosyl hydrolase family 26